uniref:GGDEF domain-containing protein n=1 Tax=mine drainage metagenome TaxID=410659 RepID=E6QPM0_9ZZZZ
MFLDLDHFKLVNDSLGHGAGDAVLNEVATRLTSSMRDSDTVARLGGDEFAMVVGSLVAPEDAAIVARKILASLDQLAVIDGHEVLLSCSIGISLYPQDGMDDETLIKHADVAMYYAKEGGRSTFRFYSAEMNVSTPLHLAMEIEKLR